MSAAFPPEAPEAPFSEALPLEALRARVRALEAGVAGRRVVAPLGAPALDACLPGGGLPLAGLHEVAGERAEWDDGVALGFLLALLSRVLAARDAVGGGGPVLWVAGRLDLHAPGLAAAGLDPGRLVLVRAGAEAERLWALEEGLRAPDGSGSPFAAVVGEIGALDRTSGRRLQLAAEAAGLPCFVLRRQLAAPRRAEAPSAALTRWRIAPLPSGAVETEPEKCFLPPCGGGLRRGAIGGSRSEEAFSFGRASGPAAPHPNPPPRGGREHVSAALAAALARLPGRARWRVELLRCRGAAPADFLVEWNHATGDFGLVAPLRDGPLEREPAPERVAESDAAPERPRRLAG